MRIKTQNITIVPGEVYYSNAFTPCQYCFDYCCDFILRLSCSFILWYLSKCEPNLDYPMVLAGGFQPKIELGAKRYFVVNENNDDLYF